MEIMDFGNKKGFLYDGTAYSCEDMFRRITAQGKGDFADKREKIESHVERTAEMCGAMADSLGLTEKQKRRVQNAAWLHDIGKSLKKKEKRKQHHLPENVCRAVSKALTDSGAERDQIEEFLLGSGKFQKLLEIIEAHKRREDLPRKELWESAVLRMCDKIDKYHKTSWEEADEKYLKNLADVTNQLKYAGIEEAHIQRFEAVCEEMRARVKQSVSQQG